MDYPICNQVIGLKYLRRVDVCIISNYRDGQIVALVRRQYCPVHKARAVEHSIRDEVVVE